MQVIDAGGVLSNGGVRQVLCGGCAPQDATLGIGCGCAEWLQGGGEFTAGWGGQDGEGEG